MSIVMHPTNFCLTRRDALKRLGLASGSTILTTWPIRAADSGDTGKRLRFGIIADVHKDIMHDADERLQVFIDHMKKAEVDFIVQLGDFCVPKDNNQGFLDVWNSFPGARYHVLGNHDTDGGFKRQDTVAWWKMPARYYSFDRSGLHFVVLDGNDRPKDHKSGYPRFMADDQLEWLRKDLAATELQTMIFVHQSLERPERGGVQNGVAVRAILEQANADSGRRKVVACFSGHHHRDYVRQINDIVYPQINSASYHWVGGSFRHVRYSAEIDKKYPNIKNTVPYKEPVFGLVTIDRAKGFLSIEGRRSSFVGPAPWEIGRDREYWDADTLTAGVSNWKMPVG